MLGENISIKNVNVMVSLYGNLIIKGKKTITEVSDDYKKEVCQWLIDNDYPELAEDNV